jgi:hypothetical protein
MNRIVASPRSILSGLARYSRSIIVSAIMLMPWSPAFAQQTQPYHLISAATTNSTSIKGTNGGVISIVAINTTATIYYLKFYDTAAAPTCNTTAVALTFPIPATASSTGGGLVVSLPQEARFLSGIGICLVGGIADNDNSNAATGVAVDVFFK